MSWIRFLILCSLRNLWRSPRRTVFSLLAIAASTCALILFQSFVLGVKESFRVNVITSAYGHYQIFAKGGQKPDPKNPFGYQIHDYQALVDGLNRDVAPLKMASRRQLFFSLLNAGERSFGGTGIGVDAREELNFLTLNQVVKGKHLGDSGAQGIFLGVVLAENLGAAVGDTITLVVTTEQGSVNAMDFEVCGFFRSGVTEIDRGMFYIWHQAAIELLGTTGAERILLGFNVKDELILKPKLQEWMATNFPHLEIVHWHQLADFFFNTMGWLEGQFNVFRIIMLLISTLSIVNVFTISLLERVGEFGTLRAIGTYRRELSLLIFCESVMQAILGTFLGVVISLILIYGALHQGITMPPPPLMSVPFHVDFEFYVKEAWVTVLLCALVSALAGLFPTLRVARMNIVQALGRNV